MYRKKLTPQKNQNKKGETANFGGKWERKKSGVRLVNKKKFKPNDVEDNFVGFRASDEGKKIYMVKSYFSLSFVFVFFFLVFKWRFRETAWRNACCFFLESTSTD